MLFVLTYCKSHPKYGKIKDMNPKAQDAYTQAYNKWVVDQSPANMAELVSAFMPTVNAELQQYSGSKDLLRARAKSFVIQAVKSFNPLGPAKLNSWVVTNLKQLSRYGKRLRPIRASEDLIRSAADLNRVTLELEDRLGRKPTDEELQDETGWTPKTMARIRAAAVPSVQATGVVDSEGAPEEPAVAKSDEIPFISDAVYGSLGKRDRTIFDHRLGTHGKEQLSGVDLAKKLGVSPAYVSQRASRIASLIAELGAK